MKILQPHSKTGWITAVIDGRWVQAKVYDDPSDYGIDNGRVSKLAIGKTDTRDPNQDFFAQMCYNYDRGLDFKKISIKQVRSIVAQLETLPKLFTPEEAAQEEERTRLPVPDVAPKTRFSL